MKQQFIIVFTMLSSICFAQRNVLFVVGNTTLSTADQNIRDRLALTFDTVTVVDDGATVTGDATGKELIFISSTVSSTDVNTEFLNSAYPLIVCEHAIFDDLKMTNTSGTDHASQSSITNISIHKPSHQMAALLTGTVAIHTSAQTVTWGLPSSGGVKVATLTTDTNKAVIFGYLSGATMVGLSAPARRVGFYFNDNSAEYWNSNGRALFDAALDWAQGISANTAPYLSITAPATNNVFTGNSDITVSATATDTTGTIVQVQFFNGGVSIGVDNTSPYSIVWNDVHVGCYTLTAVATDDDAATGTSSAVYICVSISGSDGNTVRVDGTKLVGDSTLFNDGTNIGIGTTSPRGKLDVNGLVVIGEDLFSDTLLTYGTPLILSVDGGIASKEILVTETSWADFVFDDNYELLTLDSVRNFISAHNHLPGVPSETEIKHQGLNLGEISSVLLKKIEELTLYILVQQQRIDFLEEKLEK